MILKKAVCTTVVIPSAWHIIKIKNGENKQVGINNITAVRLYRYKPLESSNTHKNLTACL